ncbi:integrase core domain-containing protein [Roseibium sp.]|uniref:integrase core domain-containing protein n=1 Tax=Roseibium sp. TaxID=1936156 RepID=UPI003D9C3249
MHQRNTVSSPAEARTIIENRRKDYNTTRPHTSLDGIAPADYARHLTTSRPASRERRNCPAQQVLTAKPNIRKKHERILRLNGPDQATGSASLFPPLLLVVSAFCTVFLLHAKNTEGNLNVSRFSQALKHLVEIDGNLLKTRANPWRMRNAVKRLLLRLRKWIKFA